MGLANHDPLQNNARIIYTIMYAIHAAFWACMGCWAIVSGIRKLFKK